MKYVILIGDGMADYPLDELGGKTVLQAADKPNMDAIAKKGRNGLLETVPQGFEPGSDVANLSIMGYDPELYYPGGRGLVEAAAMGIQLSTGDLAMRANIITVEDGRIIDYSAGKITNEEARELIKLANAEFGGEGVEFYPGVSYRNLLMLRGVDIHPYDLKCNAPHDHPGKEFKDLLIEGRGEAKKVADRLNDIMIRSQEVFEKSEVNKKRQREGKPLANMLWFWGAGRKKRDMPTMKEKFGVEGVVITAIDLIRGLGILSGLKPINVEGANAYFDTNFEGKADAAIKALNGGANIAIIHVEAPDEAGHEGLMEEKIKAIENIDKRLLGRLMENLEGDYRIGLLPDHYTPISVRTHVHGPVPFAIMGSGIEPDGVERFDEESAKKGGYGLKKGHEFIELLTS